MRGRKGEEQHNIAIGSGTPSVAAVAKARAERKRKKALEMETGARPQPIKAFYCPECELFYYEVNWFTGEKRNGKCPVGHEPKRTKKR
jgi:hypothetical protein